MPAPTMMIFSDAMLEVCVETNETEREDVEIEMMVVRL